MDKKHTKALNSQFNDAIGGIMMPVNDMNNARFTERWVDVKGFIATIREKLDILEKIADEHLA